MVTHRGAKASAHAQHRHTVASTSASRLARDAWSVWRRVLKIPVNKGARGEGPRSGRARRGRVLEIAENGELQGSRRPASTETRFARVEEVVWPVRGWLVRTRVVASVERRLASSASPRRGAARGSVPGSPTAVTATRRSPQGTPSTAGIAERRCSPSEGLHTRHDAWAPPVAQVQTCAEA